MHLLHYFSFWFSLALSYNSSAQESRSLNYSTSLYNFGKALYMQIAMYIQIHISMRAPFPLPVDKS